MSANQQGYPQKYDKPWSRFGGLHPEVAQKCYTRKLRHERNFVEIDETLDLQDDYRDMEWDYLCSFGNYDDLWIYD